MLCCSVGSLSLGCITGNCMGISNAHQLWSLSTTLLFLLHFPPDVMCNVEDALCWCFAHETLCAFSIVLQGACFTEVVFALCHDRVCNLFPGLPADVACEWQAVILACALLLIRGPVSPLCLLEPLLPLVPLLCVQGLLSPDTAHSL